MPTIQELTIRVFHFGPSALLDPMPTFSTIGAFYGFSVWLLGPECVYLGVVFPFWILYLHFSPKLFLHVGFIKGFPCCTTQEEGIHFKDLDDLSYFHQHFIDNGLVGIGAEQLELNMG